MGRKLYLRKGRGGLRFTVFNCEFNSSGYYTIATEIPGSGEYNMLMPICNIYIYIWQSKIYGA